MAKSFTPSYIRLMESGELARRAQLARERLSYCDICPRQCHVDRLNNVLGACNTGALAVMHSAAPHFGEERPLVGRAGSGTVFFSHCNLGCLYCQNYDISQLGAGQAVSDAQLARAMLQLQAAGCHNINLVSPSHVVPQILGALVIAAGDGLQLPLVYNSGGYDALSTLALLDGVVDIYMPDMKYADPEIGQQFSCVPDYPQINQAAVREMHRQVGDLTMDRRGIAQQGLLIRHLVLPEGHAGTAEIVAFLADEISKDTYINMMPQYRPYYRANALPEMNRPITDTEYQAAVQAALDQGLERLDHLRAPRRRR